VRLTSTASLDPADYPFGHDIRVRFAETDAMGIVHHAAYLPYLEETRVAYLRHIGHPYETIVAEGLHLTITEVNVRYLAPLRFDDVVTIHCRVSLARRVSMEMTYLLRRGDDPIGTAITGHGAVDMDGKPARTPSWLQDAMGSITT